MRGLCLHFHCGYTFKTQEVHAAVRSNLHVTWINMVLLVVSLFLEIYTPNNSNDAIYVMFSIFVL